MKNNSLIFLLIISGVGFIFYKTTYSLFSDTASSQNNVFSAATEFFTPTPQPTPVDIASYAVISEVQIDGGIGQTNNNDFIELYNPTNSPYNLNGHRLVKRTASATPSDILIIEWTTDTFITAHSFYLWASSANPTYPSSIGADISSSDTLARNNSVALRIGPSTSGTIIDALSWSSVSGSLVEGTRFSPDPGPNQSMERKALSTSNSGSMAIGGSDEFKGNGYDTNNNSLDFDLRTIAQPQNSSSPTEQP